MSRKILLCTDLDRTLLPNGPQAESPEARRHFAVLTARPEVTLAYVTGRHQALVRQAISDYSLPSPDYVLADVGTTIYEIAGGNHAYFGYYGEQKGDGTATITREKQHAETTTQILIMLENC